MEGDAVCARVDRRDDVTRRRQTGAEYECRHERGLLESQRRESGLLGDSLGQQPRPPLPQVCVWPELVGSVGADDQERPVAGRARQFREDLQA